MSDTIIVRPAEEADLETLRAIAQRPELNLTDEVFEGQQKGDAIFAVALRNDEVVGTGVLDLRESDLQPEVKLLYVRPKARRTGVGSALTAFLEAQAKERGFDACYMAVDPNNERAVPMVVDLDYSATGDHKFVESPDDEQVNDPTQRSEHYAVYRKSLTMN